MQSAEIPTTDIRRGAVLFWIALHLALFFVGLELMKACRASTWTGMSAMDGLGLAVAGLGYGVLAGAGVLLCGSALRRATRQRVPWRIAGPCGGAAAGAVIWAFLSVHREQAPTWDDILVLGALAAYALFGVGWLRASTSKIAVGRADAPGCRSMNHGRIREIVACFRQPGASALPLTGFGAVAAVPLAAGLLAVPLAADYGLFHASFRASVQWGPLAWAALMGLCGVVLWRKPGRRWAGRMLYLAIALAGPWLALRYLDRLPPSEAPANAPNLIFVISDALRADMVSPGGSPELPVLAPHLESLARSGAVFEDAYALGPWTMPSVSALFGSSYPPSLTPGAAYGTWRDELWRYAVNPAPKALAAQLRERGYATGAITANALLWGMPGLLEGFDLSLQAHPILLVRAGLFRACPFLWETLCACVPALAPKRPHDCTETLNRLSAGFLRRIHDRPFFLYLHYIAPHAPYDPPERFRTMEGSWPFYYPYDGGEAWGIPLLGPGFGIEEKDRPYVRSLYEGEVRYVDEAIGLLMKRLDALGLRERTYVCFTSDHGEELWEHGRWGHGQSVRQEQARVPWMIAGPGIGSQRIPGPVSAIDCLPTLAGLVNAAPQTQWRGLSWADRLRGGTVQPPQRPIFIQGTCDTCWPHPQQAMIENGYKLIRELGGGSSHLYDLAKDPGEQSDLAAQEPGRAAEMGLALDAWQASFPFTFDADSAEPGNGAEQRQALDGMGYLR